VFYRRSSAADRALIRLERVAEYADQAHEPPASEGTDDQSETYGKTVGVAACH
jgi:hypothetical protein